MKNTQSWKYMKVFSSLYACKPDCIAVHVDLLPPPILNHSQESNPCNRVSLFPKQSISEKSPHFCSFPPFFDLLKNRRKSLNELITLTWPLKSPYHGEFKYAKILQNFEKLKLYLRKIENSQILYKDICVKIIAKFLRKNCAICFPLFKAFQKAIKIRDSTTVSRSKH